jgi:PAS domain-containing protein
VRVVCSYSHKSLGTKPPLRDGSLSHGMCRECGEHFGRQWSGLSHDQYLDRFDFPILLVEGEGRIVAANRAAGTLLGHRPSEMVGLLGGEAMECSRARLPGGCGRTVHCPTCAIRNAVTETHRSGVPLARVPARLVRSDRDVDLLLTTTLEDDLVRVVVEPVG